MSDAEEGKGESVENAMRPFLHQLTANSSNGHRPEQDAEANRRTSSNVGPSKNGSLLRLPLVILRFVNTDRSPSSPRLNMEVRRDAPDLSLSMVDACVVVVVAAVVVVMVEATGMPDQIVDVEVCGSRRYTPRVSR